MRTHSTVLILASLIAPWTVPRAPAADGLAVRWTCQQHFDAAFHAECRVDDPPKKTALPESAPTMTGQIRASQTRYTPVAMRPDEMMAFALWRVPIYGVPTNRADTEYLLHAVLCGRAVGCTVRYDLGTPELVQRTPHPFIR